MRKRYSLVEAESTQKPVFVAIDGGFESTGFVMDRGVCVVGARRLVHLPLSSQLISKAHALLVHDGHSVYVRDLASRNSTYVNDSPVREVRLSNGDTVRFGHFHFRCHSGFGRKGQPAPAPAELWLGPGGFSSRQVFRIKGETFLVGSRASCDLVLDQEDVALAHAVIFLCDGRRFIRDLSTPGGTLVNGQAIRETSLKDGDLIQIGSARLEYHAGPAPVRFDEDLGGLLPLEEGLRDPASTSVIGLANQDVQRKPEAPPVETELAQEAAATTDHADNIVLPWDDPAPIELEAMDSHAGV